MNRFVFKLYIAGNTNKSETALASLRRICEGRLAGLCDIIVIDVLEQPHLAEESKILATPTLVKESPPPARRIIGDLSDIQKVLFGLGLENITPYSS